MSATSPIHRQKSRSSPGGDQPGPGPLGIRSALSRLPGIGPKRAAALEERGIATVGDLLFSFPARYLDWRQLKPLHEVLPGETAAVTGRLSALSERPMRGSRWRRLLSGWLQDGQGARLRI